MVHFTAAEFWDERYQSEQYVYGLNPNDFLSEHIALFKTGDCLLSLAEGEGRNAVFMAKYGCQVSAVDFSANGRKKAMQLARAHRIKLEYELSDLTVYDMGKARWNGIVSIFCHLSDTQRPTLYKNIIHALKPGGIFLLESYNTKQLDYGTGGPDSATNLLSREELEFAFSGFDVIVCKDVIREIHEGKSHTGLSSVTQCIVRKPTAGF